MNNGSDSEIELIRVQFKLHAVCDLRYFIYGRLNEKSASNEFLCSVTKLVLWNCDDKSAINV